MRPSTSTHVLSDAESEPDIFSSLTGNKNKKRKIQQDEDSEEVHQDVSPHDLGADEDDDLNALIRETVARRDKKDGTKLLKKTKGSKKITKGETGGGSFQSMGLNPSLLRSLTLRGYKVPTPIQRLTIPILLETPPRDLVGMARTGSGKTLAYMIPLVQRLGGRHATTFGLRALILVPARELALQVLKVGKELARGWGKEGGEHAGDAEDEGSKGQSMRWGLIVGGEGLDEQFEMIASNPDVIIATPGRLLHLIVEMNLDLRAVQYVVFDEADRLFEMGFSTALDEILHRLPTNRQTLLFSATLPKTLVEFAKAGLKEPKLIRLDADSKISTDLRMAFFSVKQAEKDACLLVLLQDVIGVPLKSAQQAEEMKAQEAEEEEDDEEKSHRKNRGKGKEKRPNSYNMSPHQTLIFVATKHHVEYITNLLATAGYSTSHIYGSLDQTARTLQMDRFRKNLTNILVVTDVAARGIDIPVLENVVNYDFPTGPRVFIHRVGRTARAGRRGWAWSFVTNTELPHLLDLQLFLGRPIYSDIPSSSSTQSEETYTQSLILGAFPRSEIDDETEHIKGLDIENGSLPTLRAVMVKGQGMYERSQGKASPASYTRAKGMIKSGKWGFAGSAAGDAYVHPVLGFVQSHKRKLQGGDEPGPHSESTEKQRQDQEEARKVLLRAVSAFTPNETVLEIGARGKTSSAALMKERRKALTKARDRAVIPSTTQADGDEDMDQDQQDGSESERGEDVEMADEEGIAAVFSTSIKTKSKKDFRDSDFYMSHYQKDAMTEKGYSLKSGASFTEQARQATFDLTNDESTRSSTSSRPFSQLKWDRKKKKFVKGDGVGADNVKLVKTESGARLPVSYRSGRYEEWMKKTKKEVPRVGEAEKEGRARAGGFGKGGKKWKHTSTTDAKPLDKLSTSYERKVRQLKKKETSDATSGDNGDSSSRKQGYSPSKPGNGNFARGKGKPKAKPSRFGNKSVARVKSELKSADQIRKTRGIADRKRQKNARPGQGSKGRKRR